MTAPTPPPLPPAGRAPVSTDQQKIDLSHLRLLVVFHLALVATIILCIGQMLVHLLFGNSPSEEMAQKLVQHFTGRAPKELEPFAVIGMSILGLVVVAFNGLSVWCILRRKARRFSILVAAADCLWLPIGTALGVFTITVLRRDSVRDLYRGGLF